MNVLLRHKNIGEPSCSRLINRLSELGVFLHKTEDYNNQKADILIRWGHSGLFPLRNHAIEINSAISINLGSNKRKSRKSLQENGVSVPKSYFSKEECLLSDDLVYPLIGRPSYHTQGKNVEFIENEKQLKDSVSTYYSEFIPKTKEYRVYIFGGKVLGVLEKVPKNKRDIAWNSHLGAVFYDLAAGDYDTNILTEAIKASQIIGQYFSGVDIMIYENRPYILELNSSLALSNPNRVNIFAKAFKYLIDYYNNTGKLHFDITKRYYHPCL